LTFKTYDILSKGSTFNKELSVHRNAFLLMEKMRNKQDFVAS